MPDGSHRYSLQWSSAMIRGLSIETSNLRIYSFLRKMLKLEISDFLYLLSQLIFRFPPCLEPRFTFLQRFSKEAEFRSNQTYGLWGSFSMRWCISSYLFPPTLFRSWWSLLSQRKSITRMTTTPTLLGSWWVIALLKTLNLDLT